MLARTSLGPLSRHIRVQERKECHNQTDYISLYLSCPLYSTIHPAHIQPLLIHPSCSCCPSPPWASQWPTSRNDNRSKHRSIYFLSISHSYCSAAVQYNRPGAWITLRPHGHSCDWVRGRRKDERDCTSVLEKLHSCCCETDEATDLWLDKGGWEMEVRANQRRRTIVWSLIPIYKCWQNSHISLLFTFLSILTHLSSALRKTAEHLSASSSCYHGNPRPQTNLWHMHGHTYTHSFLPTDHAANRRPDTHVLVLLTPYHHITINV